MRTDKNGHAWKRQDGSARAVCPFCGVESKVMKCGVQGGHHNVYRRIGTGERWSAEALVPGKHVHENFAVLRRLAHTRGADARTGHRPALRPRSGYQPGRGSFVLRSALRITPNGWFCAGNTQEVGHVMSDRRTGPGVRS